MIFQMKFVSVFLFVVMHMQLSESFNLRHINITLFVFNHPSSCKRNDIYNLDYFSCSPCDPNANLQSSSDGFTCECAPNSKQIANYDSYFRHPICAEPCHSTKTNKCRNITTSMIPNACGLKYINFTMEQAGKEKHIRIYPHLPNPNECRCDTKYYYIYSDFCILKELLKPYLNYNAFWQRGSIYADLKFIAFFCQSLRNMTACNHMANLCVQSYFDTDKNSPCSVFLLAQASDATLYSSIGDELNDVRPFLFYRKGKDTTLEMESRIDYPFYSKADKVSDAMELFTTVYSLDGHLVRWGPFRPNHINLCSQNLQRLYEYFQYYKSFHISCELTMESVIDLATMYANKQFFNVFLNHTKDNIQYMQAIPILIDNVFEGNGETNVGEWQLVKRFQIIGAHLAFNLAGAAQMPIYEDTHKLKLFKSIRILRKFELHSTVTKGNELSIPLIVLNYHQINISLNTSLNEVFKFDVVVKLKTEMSSLLLYKICLPTFLTIGLGFAIFRSYIFKSRRNLECCDMIIVLQFFLHLLSNTGNSFLITVIIDVIYSILKTATQSDVTPMLSLQNINVFTILIYSALGLKIFYFAVTFWKIAHIDLFFVDWERPKGCDPPLHLKNNLETTSQCSSIRAFAENNVSTWRTFFVANEWIELSCKQKTSCFMLGFVSLTIYEAISTVYPQFHSDTTIELFLCIIIFCVVYIMQCIIRNPILNYVFGSPLQKFMDICSMANVSIVALLDPSFGFYIHGRSPHGFSDIDMSSLILQLQRESQNMCGKRGLLSDSDFQAYIILPPLNLRTQIDKLLPLKNYSENLSQAHIQKEIGSIGNNFEGTEKSTTAFTRVNRFFCAFIDHAIKDMDYIIKEKSFIENLLGCEFESYLAGNKGTFYIDNDLTFDSLFLYGNQNHIFVTELLLLTAINLLTCSFVSSIIIVCIWNKLFQKMFRVLVRNNVAEKTLIDKRFLL